MTVEERNVQVKNLLGLNLSAAATLAEVANKFTSQVEIEWGENQASAKCIVQLIILGVGLGSKLKLCPEGSDANEAVAPIQALLERRLGEE
jgi:phosphotransferase system HPr (HPr) family protein